ncbi:MAG: hypothetical protein JST37_09725 [Bacteroidetes bacterium]|nr:hypothetical protein [Bacteroidota bacterium]
MKRLLTTIILATCLTIAHGQSSTISIKQFTDYIDSVGLKFKMPDNYKETDIIENGDLYYVFAIKNKNADFEVRYSIWPMKPKLKEFEKCKTQPGCSMIDPNRMFKGIAEANVLNMTAGKGANIGGFGKEAVKGEFNADIGGTAFFELNCAFGKGYKYGQMVVLHKDNTADVIITFMSNDKDKHSELMFEPFHALTFK